MKSALSVWWDDAIAGELRLNEHGDISFVYNADWVADSARPALSVSLPKRTEPFGRRECRPFFDGLLPEESALENVARALGISKGNDFALLKALGGDVAGALTLWPAEETPLKYDEKTQTKPLTDVALVKLLETLPKRPLLAGEEGLRLSLAGAQTKLPVVLVGERIALPVPGQPTTHILKPPIKRFAATTENESFAMQLAADLGLYVAPVEVRVTNGKPYLLVTRYDRTTDADGRVRRLHQEDFCQALGIPPERKYAAEGGPTFRTGFELLRTAASRPAIEVLRLLDAAIFNFIIGNADAHGKNFSLLYGNDGTTLAPLYDLLCTVAYPDLSAKSAMKIGGASTINDLTPRTWQKFAEETKLGAAFVRRRVKELTDASKNQAARTAKTIAKSGLDKAELSRFAKIVQDRAASIAALL
jgi:serine/threonine-protein kinase HipA